MVDRSSRSHNASRGVLDERQVLVDERSLPGDERPAREDCRSLAACATLRPVVARRAPAVPGVVEGS
jgi:hypothetical protein